MNELDHIEATLNAIRKQSFTNYELYVCVNQPDDWWEKEEKIEICRNNIKLMDKLNSIEDINIKVIDKCSKGKGWQGKKHGVGWARKTVMDAIAANAQSENDIILCTDADTVFNENYFQSIADTIIKYFGKPLSIPYYHKLTGDEAADRSILRYEIYMRYYVLNLWRINSPYNFTAVGSAMALEVALYKKVNGITPKLSGEDFYFMQKLRKTGEIVTWNKEKVYPAARFSDRVFFGTGPAMIKGSSGNWESYPIYDYHDFAKIETTYNLFPQLFEKDIDTPISDFLANQFKGKEIWQPLRENSKNKKYFIKACHEKIDGLRILQFLKGNNDTNKINDELRLKEYLYKFYPSQTINALQIDWDNLSFEKSELAILDKIRNFLLQEEEKLQIAKWG